MWHRADRQKFTDVSKERTNPHLKGADESNTDHLEVDKDNELDADFLSVLFLVVLGAKWIKFYFGS